MRAFPISSGCWDVARMHGFTTLDAQLGFIVDYVYNTIWCYKQNSSFGIYSAEAKTIVSADSSSFGLVAALWQIQPDGRRAPLVFASRTLSDQEKSCLTDTGGCSSSWVMRWFESYPMGQDELFVIETDHNPLVDIMNKQDLDRNSPRIQRWKIWMMEYYLILCMFPRRSCRCLMCCQDNPW